MRLLQYTLLLSIAAIGAAYPVADFQDVSARSEFQGLVDFFHDNLSDDVLDDLAHLKDMFNEVVGPKYEMVKRDENTTTIDWDGFLNLFGGGSATSTATGTSLTLDLFDGSATTSEIVSTSQSIDPGVSLTVASAISDASAALDSVSNFLRTASSSSLLFDLFPDTAGDVESSATSGSSSARASSSRSSSSLSARSSSSSLSLSSSRRSSSSTRSSSSSTRSSSSSTRSSSSSTRSSSSSTRSTASSTSTPFSLSNITSINANTSSSTFDLLVLYANSSGIIWTLLDQVADSPSLVSSGANYTAGIIANILENPPNLTTIFNAASNSKVNLSALAGPLMKSGLLSSLADGLLLDDNFRPRLAELINRGGRANTPLLEWVVDDLLAPPKNSKRDLFSGSLTSFVMNFAGSFINSELFLNIFGDVVNSLNDTGVAVYVVKKFLEEDKYVNVTGDFFEQVVNSPRIDWSEGKNFNVKGLLSQALSNPAAVFDTLGKVLNGGSSQHVFAAFSKYYGAVKKLILEIESEGLFDYLNKQLFSTTMSTQTTTAGSNRARVANPLKFREVTVGNATVTLVETATAESPVEFSATVTAASSVSASATPEISVLTTLANSAGGVLALSALAIGLQVLLVMMT